MIISKKKNNKRSLPPSRRAICVSLVKERLQGRWYSGTIEEFMNIEINNEKRNISCHVFLEKSVCSEPVSSEITYLSCYIDNFMTVR